MVFFFLSSSTNHKITETVIFTTELALSLSLSLSLAVKQKTNKILACSKIFVSLQLVLSFLENARSHTNHDRLKCLDLPRQHVQGASQLVHTSELEWSTRGFVQQAEHRIISQKQRGVGSEWVSVPISKARTFEHLLAFREPGFLKLSFSCGWFSLTEFWRQPRFPNFQLKYRLMGRTVHL